MARTGVLSDAYVRSKHPELFPLDARTSDNIYGRTLKPTGRKHRDRKIYRARAPWIDHHEFSKMMNAQNVEPHVEAFGEQLSNLVNAGPNTTFKGRVEEYIAKFPQFRNVVDEVANYIIEAKLDPIDFMYGRNQYGMHPHRGRIRSATVRGIHDKVMHDLRGSADVDRILEVNRAFQNTMDQMLTPEQKFKAEDPSLHDQSLPLPNVFGGDPFEQRASMLFGPGWTPNVNDPD